MKPNDIIINDKVSYILNTPARYLLVEGPTGTGKTFALGLRTFFNVFNSHKGQDQYAIIGESIGTIQKMFIDDPASPFNIFSAVSKYVGGSRPHFRITGRYSTKRIYLGGFGTARDWKKILGLNLHGLHIEEMSVAHDDFIREAFVRAARLDTKPWVNATTNGGNPDDIFYKEFFDKSNVNIEMNQNIPQITLDYISETKEKDDKFEYVYFGFDDSPAQSEETINDIMGMFPMGSFFYMSKVIGARGFSEGAIYSEYMKRDKHLLDYDYVMNKKNFNFIKFVIGFDVGVSDHTVGTLVGFTQNFKECIVIDSFEINQVGTEEIYSKFKKWWEPYNDYNILSKTHGIYFDPGGGGKVLEKTLKSRFLNDYNLLTGDAIKKRIVERIEGNIKLLHSDRLLFTTRAEGIYKAFTSAIYTKDKTKTDPRLFNQHINKDRVDSTEYAQAPFIDVMLRRT